MNTSKLAALAGLITPEVGEYLAQLAADVPADQAIVEVGSFRGKSTCYLASGAKDGHGAHVYAVDAWDTPGNVTGRFGFAEPSTRETFDAQVASMRLKSRITALQGFSTDVAQAWTGPKVGLLFIDGDHAAQSVQADLHAWEPHLAVHSLVVFDDYDTPKNPGVAEVVDSLPGELRILEHLAIWTAQ